MNFSGDLGLLLQDAAVAAGAPALVGVMRQTRARLEGRYGAGLGQPWRDLAKLLRKQPIHPHGTTAIFRSAPALIAGTSLLAAGIVPLVTLGSPLDRAGDLFTLVGILLLGSVALALAGLDTGTAFGGMGASREVMIAALVEPSILLAIFALSIPVHSTSLSAIVSAAVSRPGSVATPAAALALVALVVVVLAEAGRLPFDNPNTHLELTMIHEAMLLEYSGPALALVEWASSMRLVVLLALVADLFLPWGIAGPHAALLLLPLALLAISAKTLLLGAALAAGEVFLAKMRLFRVPELLAGSFLLGLLAVTASYFLSSPSG